MLTYRRCTHTTCLAYRDDLHGHRAAFTSLRLPRCVLSTAPALWGTRAAYGLACHKGKFFDPDRSGLYVKTGKGAPRHLRRQPPNALTEIDSVDLRGRQVAAIDSQDASVGFTETVTGAGFRSFTVAATDGDTEQSAPGLALGSGGTMWTLAESSYLDTPHQSVLSRLIGNCRRHETLTNASPPGVQSGYPASDLAVDGSTVYFAVTGTGIVRHTFAPAPHCA